MAEVLQSGRSPFSFATGFPRLAFVHLVARLLHTEIDIYVDLSCQPEMGPSMNLALFDTCKPIHRRVSSHKPMRVISGQRAADAISHLLRCIDGRQQDGLEYMSSK